MNDDARAPHHIWVKGGHMRTSFRIGAALVCRFKIVGMEDA